MSDLRASVRLFPLSLLKRIDIGDLKPNCVEEALDATSTPIHRITKMILEKGQLLETEQMFREAGEQ